MVDWKSLRVVLSAKNLISNKKQIARAWQQHQIGFLKLCRLLLNMVCEYSAGSSCAVYFGTLESGCVSPNWVVLSIG